MKRRNPEHFAPSAPNKKPRIESQPKWFYAVKAGRKPGIYDSWAECYIQVNGHKGAVYKKFASYELASSFVTPSSVVVAPKQQPILSDAHLILENNVKNKPLEDKIVVWTDGACSNNGKANARGGVGVWFGDNDPRNVSERLKGKQTNQRAELMAGLRALVILREELSNPSSSNVNVRPSIEIITDSNYLVQGMTDWVEKWKKNGWVRKPMNEDLWRILDTARSGLDVTWTHVIGHSGVYGNEKADELATQGVLKSL